MSDISREVLGSINLEKAFESYRETEEYKKELYDRKKTLEVLGIFEEFADALAQDSLKTGIRVAELLDVKDEILTENDSIINSIDNGVNLVSDNVNFVSNSRIYGGRGI